MVLIFSLIYGYNVCKNRSEKRCKILAYRRVYSKKDLGISLAQFFAGDSGKLDLTSDQTELLDIWDGLEVKEREIVLSLMRSLKK